MVCKKDKNPSDDNYDGPSPEVVNYPKELQGTYFRTNQKMYLRQIHCCIFGFITISLFFPSSSCHKKDPPSSKSHTNGTL